jgi:hypothetical protein
MNASKAQIRTKRLRALFQTTALLLLTCVSRPAPTVAQDKAALRSAPPIVYVSNGGGGIYRSECRQPFRYRDGPFSE